MTSKEEKKRRQELVKAAKVKQHAKETSKMPISTADLKALLEFLDRPNFLHCDHSLKETIEFLDNHSLDKSKIIPWLNEYGGYCDCEVVFNVGDAWGEYVGVTLDNENRGQV